MRKKRGGVKRQEDEDKEGGKKGKRWKGKVEGGSN